MFDAHLLNLLTRLTRTTSTSQLAECLDEFLPALFSPSAYVLAWGRAHPHYSLAPIHASASFPESLLQSFRINDPFFAVPQLKTLDVDQMPRLERLEDLTGEKNQLWWTLLRQRQYHTVCAFGSTDLRGQYLTYLCLTDPVRASTTHSVPDLLAVLCPILHTTLGRIRREKKRQVKARPNTLLSPREQEIFEWVRKGKTNAEISMILGISFPTIKNHVQKIMFKLHATNRTDAVAKGMSNHIGDTQFLDTLIQKNPR